MAVNTISDILIFAVLFLFGALGIYSLWDNYNIELDASPEKWASYKPGKSEYGSFEELRAINPEVTAWLNIYGTAIDYPVVYTPESRKYLMFDAFGEYSLTGALFIDPKNKPDFSDMDTIIYGHHMEHDLLFGPLDDFLRKPFFDSHRYGKIFYNGAYHGMEIAALAKCNAYDDSIYRTGIVEVDQQKEYLEHLQDSIVFTRDEVQLNGNDRLVIMSTCSGEETNARTVVIGKLLDYVPDDPFEAEDVEGNGLTGRVHGFLGLPWYFWGALGLFGFAALVWIIRRGRRGTDVDYSMPQASTKAAPVPNEEQS